MADDGYASPDNGRRRKKAGGRSGGWSLPSWEMGLVGLASAVVLAGLLTMIALGTVAFSRSQDVRDGGGTHLVNARFFCLPTEAIAVYDYDHDPILETHPSNSVLLERGQDLVTVHIQINNPHGDDDLTVLGRTATGFYYIDSRCIPPSDSFAACDGCADAPSFDDDLLNLTTLTVPVQYSAFAQTIPVQAYAIYGYEVITPVQNLVDGVVFYGIPIMFTSAAGQTGFGVTTVEATLTYRTSASDGWKVPDFCTGGQCLSAPA